MIILLLENDNQSALVKIFAFLHLVCKSIESKQFD